MTARISAKEARRLGLDLTDRGGGVRSGHGVDHPSRVSDGTADPPSPPRRKKEPYHTRCRKCGEHFTTMNGETRHMNESGHRTFELVLNQERNSNDGTQGEAPARDAEQDEGAEAG